MVRKSHPASEMISPVYVECKEMVSTTGRGGRDCGSCANVSERGTHNDGVVVVLLVVVVDLAD